MRLTLTLKSNRGADEVGSMFCRITDGLRSGVSLIEGEDGGVMKRQFDGEFASRSNLAGDVSLASMGERQMLDDGQPESGSSGFTRARLVDTVESLEDARQVFGRNAR